MTYDLYDHMSMTICPYDICPYNMFITPMHNAYTYSLIYVSASGGDLVWVGALVVSVLLVLGSLLFVRAW
jgi:hypothetical protein